MQMIWFCALESPQCSVVILSFFLAPNLSILHAAREGGGAARGFFKRILWCSQSGDRSQNNLAKFGYMLDVRVEKRKGIVLYSLEFIIKIWWFAKNKKIFKIWQFYHQSKCVYPHNFGVTPELDQRTDHGKPHGSRVNNFVREVPCNFSPPEKKFN
jgi:hypothetical protein